MDPRLSAPRRVVENIALNTSCWGACPRILVHDQEAEDVVDVNRMFLTEMKMRTKSETLKVKDIKFRLIHILVSSSTDDKHRLFFLCQQNGQ